MVFLASSVFVFSGSFPVFNRIVDAEKGMHAESVDNLIVAGASNDVSLMQMGRWCWKSAGNPILQGTPGSWDSVQTAFPVVIRDNGVYYMLYAGSKIDPVVSAEVGLAVSTDDGINFEKYGKVISRAEPYNFGIVPTDIFKIRGSATYYMVATGWNSSTMFDAGAIYGFTSTNLINWTLYSSTPIVATQSSENAVMRASVTFDGETPTIWFIICKTDGTRNLGYAVSSSSAPFNFTRHNLTDLPLSFGIRQEEASKTHLEYVRFTRRIGSVRWGLMQTYTAEGSNIRLVVSGVTSDITIMRGPFLMMQSTGDSVGWDSYFAGAHPYLLYDDETSLYRIYYCGLDINYTHRIGMAYLNLQEVAQHPPTVYGYAYVDSRPIRNYSLTGFRVLETNKIYSQLWKTAAVEVYDTQEATLNALVYFGNGEVSTWKVSTDVGSVNVSADQVRRMTLNNYPAFKVRITQGNSPGYCTVLVTMVEGDAIANESENPLVTAPPTNTLKVDEYSILITIAAVLILAIANLVLVLQFRKK